jgi:hypothetical protein
MVMTSPSQTPGTYTIDDAQADIANINNQLAQISAIIETVTDTAVTMVAPNPNATERGPSFFSFEDGTVDGWAALNGTVANSTVTATGWPTDGTHSLLLTAGGGGGPQALSPSGTSGILTQPNDPIQVQIDIYTPTALTLLYAQIAFYDDTGTFISSITSGTVSSSAGQVQTIYVNGSAPDLAQYFSVAFGSGTTLVSGTLIYGDNIRIAGNLHLSISPGGGTSAAGNTYPAGFGVVWPGQVTVQGVNGQAITMDISSSNGSPQLLFNTGTSYQSIPGSVTMGQSIVGSVPYMYLILACPDVTGTNETVFITMNSAPETGHSFNAGGNLNYVDTSSVGHDLLNWGASGIRLENITHAGDTISYQAERYTLNMSGNGAVVINTSPYSQSIIGSTKLLGVGTYRVHGMIGVNPGSTGSTTTYAFALGTSGTLAITGMRVFWEEILVQNSSAFGNTAWVTGLAPTGFTTSGVAPGGTDRLIRFDGTIIVSTAGVLNLYAATNSTANTFTVYGYGTYFEITPIG